MLGAVLSAGLGWALLPRVGWRAFLAASSAPAWLSAAALLLLLPESPRHLVVKGEFEKAEAALCRMAAWNLRSGALPAEGSFLAGRGAGAEAAVGGVAVEVVAAAAPAGAEEGRGGIACGRRAKTAPKINLTIKCRGPAAAAAAAAAFAAAKARTTLADASRRVLPPLLSGTLPQLVGYGGLSGAWYSTVLWLAEYFKRRGAGASLGIYAETMAVAAANLPGNVASWYLVDTVGRRRAGGARARRRALSDESAARSSLRPAARLPRWLLVGTPQRPACLPRPARCGAAGSQPLAPSSPPPVGRPRPLCARGPAPASLPLPRWTTCGSLAASGAAALAFAFVPPASAWSLAAACVFNGVSVAGWNALALLVSANQRCWLGSPVPRSGGVRGACGGGGGAAATRHPSRVCRPAEGGYVLEPAGSRERSKHGGALNPNPFIS